MLSTQMVRQKQQKSMEILVDTIGEVREGGKEEMLKANLFFIKSKHAFPNYHNHDYFQRQTAQPPKPLLLSTQPSSNSHKRLQTAPSEFVEHPKPYGIQNTFQYLKQLHTQPKTILHPNTRKAFHRLTLPGLAKQPFPLQAIPDKFPQEENKRESHRSRIELGKGKTQEIVELLYFRGEQRGVEVRIDILPLLRSTFRKGRVGWSGMSSGQWEQLRKIMVQVAGRRREPADFKDIVTLGSVGGLLEYWEETSRSQGQEAVRYLMVAAEEVYCYQLQKMKDSIVGSLQQQASPPHSTPLFIFDSQNGQQIKSLLQLLSLNKVGSRFICGGEGCYDAYKRLKMRSQQVCQQAKQIAGWRRAVKGQEGSHEQPKPMTAQRYQQIFSCTRQRRSHNPNRTSRHRHCSSLQHGPFLDPQKLSKHPNIFE